MSNNITSGSNMIVANDTTIGNNLYVAGTSSLGTIESNSINTTNLTSTNATLDNLDINGSLVVSGMDIMDHITNLSSNKLTNIEYDESLNKTSISGLTYINNLQTGSIDTSLLKVNGSNLLDTITTGYTNYTNNKIAEVVGSAPESLNTLKEISDLLQSDNTLTQSLVSSISGINSSITNLNTTVTTNDTKLTNVQNTVNTLSSNVSNLTSSVNSISTSNANNATSINTLNNSYNTLNTSYNTLNTSVQGLQSTVNSLNTVNTTNVNNVSNLTTSVSNLNSELDNLQASINQKLTNFNYSGGKSRINDVYVDNIEATNHIISGNSGADLNIKPSSGKISSSINFYTSNGSGTQQNKMYLNDNDLYVSTMPIKTTIDTIQTNIANLIALLSGYTYASNGDVTTIDNNVTITSGKNLIVGSINIINSLNTLNDALSGISYNITNDLTTIDNNVTITNGKNLIVGSTNIMNSLNAISDTLTGISYNIASDLTTIDNNTIVSTGNNLYLGGLTYNVKSKIDEKALVIGDNAFYGNNTFRSDSNQLRLTSYTNPTTNNSLLFGIATTNGAMNNLVKLDDFVISSGSTIDNAKNSISIVPWTSGGKKGIRISSTKLEVAPGIIETPYYSIDASGLTNQLTFKPLLTNGSYEFYTTNASDANTKTNMLSIANNNITTYAYTSLNNGTLNVSGGLIQAYKPLEMRSQDIRFLADSISGLTQMYQSGSDFVVSNNVNSGKLLFGCRDASGNYKAVLNVDNVTGVTCDNHLVLYSPNSLRFIKTFGGVNDSTQMYQTNNNFVINNNINSGKLLINCKDASGNVSPMFQTDAINGTMLSKKLEIASLDGSVAGIMGTGNNRFYLTNQNNQDLYINNDKTTLGDLHINAYSPNSNTYVDNGNFTVSAGNINVPNGSINVTNGGLNVGGNIKVNTFVAPSDSSCIGFTGNVSFDSLWNSTTLAIRHITNNATTSNFTLPSFGVYLINATITITSSDNDVNASYTVVIADQNNTSPYVAICKQSSIYTTAPIYMPKSTVFESNISFTYICSSLKTLYVGAGLRWFTTNSGTMVVNIQYTRIA